MMVKREERKETCLLFTLLYYTSVGVPIAFKDIETADCVW